MVFHYGAPGRKLVLFGLYFIVVIKLNYTTLEMTRFAINYPHQNNK